MQDEKYPHQQLFQPIPAPVSPAKAAEMVKRDKMNTLEYETNLAMVEAESVAKRPRDRCVVGYESLKASFRR